MFNINFCKNVEDPKKCTVVKANINTGLPIERCMLVFTFEATNQYSAELLKQYLDKSFSDAVETAHRKAYEQGWQDAKKKRRKKKLFVCTFTKDDIGW